MKKRDDSIPDLRAAVQEHLLPAVAELKAIQGRLRALQESLPAAPDRGEEEMDAVTELRSVLGCVLLDSIGPAIRDLQTVATDISKGPEPGDR
jgi:hypothetical protein